jgi:hypothetical protein
VLNPCSATLILHPLPACLPATVAAYLVQKGKGSTKYGTKHGSKKRNGGGRGRGRGGSKWQSEWCSLWHGTCTVGPSHTAFPFAASLLRAWLPGLLC